MTDKGDCACSVCEQVIEQIWPNEPPDPLKKNSIKGNITNNKTKNNLEPSPQHEQYVIKATNDFPFDIAAELHLTDKKSEGIHINTYVTSSGTLEVVTEAPDGLVDTTLYYTKSGNIEIVAEKYVSANLCKQLGSQCLCVDCANKPTGIETICECVDCSVLQEHKELSIKPVDKVCRKDVQSVGQEELCICQSCPKEQKEDKEDTTAPVKEKVGTCICQSCPKEIKQENMEDSVAPAKEDEPLCPCQACPKEIKQENKEETAAKSENKADTTASENEKTALCSCQVCPKDINQKNTEDTVAFEPEKVALCTCQACPKEEVKKAQTEIGNEAKNEKKTCECGETACTCASI